MVGVATPGLQRREVRNVKVLMGLAGVAALLAAAAGLALIVFTPDSGSTAEGALGLAAAISGLTTAGFAIAAAIYAQVKNLWRYAPRWARIAAYVLIASALVVALWRSAM